MVYTSSLMNDNYTMCLHDCYHKTIFSLPLCQHDIIRLQHLFVTCGVHIIKIKNFLEGRKIIQAILHSLNYFHNIGCISQDHNLPNFVCDIIKHIEFEKNTDNFLLDLEDFLTVHPCFDFIWVELSTKILQQHTLESMTKIFEMYHAQERMPVLFVMYDELQP